MRMRFAVQRLPGAMEELKSLKEFYDPDTVELMTWIKYDSYISFSSGSFHISNKLMFLLCLLVYILIQFLSDINELFAVTIPVRVRRSRAACSYWRVSNFARIDQLPIILITKTNFFDKEPKR